MVNRELDGNAWQWSKDIVSFHDEPLVLVDEHDHETGFLDKLAAHSGQGVLHRAFSLFVFNSQGELLLQQRAADKRLWPGFWSNTCCSHPRPGEETEAAAMRRLREELGFTTPLTKLFSFTYRSEYDNGLTEFEFDHVFVGRYDAPFGTQQSDWLSESRCKRQCQRFIFSP